MKKLYFLLFLVIPFTLFGKERLKEDVVIIATQFLNQKASIYTRTVNSLEFVASSDDIFHVSKNFDIKKHVPVFYILNGIQSYVIVSGDDIMPEILGYSTQQSFDLNNIPSNMLYWLESYSKEYNYIKDNNLQYYESEEIAVRNSYKLSVAPLLGDIKWDQGNPYNIKCPQNSVTGCVATAIAMILKHHNYPLVGKGSKTYVTEKLNQTLSYNFAEATFDWENMLPIYKAGQYNDKHAEAVSELMYACGVAVSMNYSPSESGAYSSNVPNSLVDYFDCDRNVQYLLRDYFDHKTWMQFIKEDLNANRPIYYSGSSTEGGHAFVFDGYDKDDLVHVNWGWSGINNGYFLISALNPSSPGIGGGTSAGGGFVTGQGMVRGIQPPTSSSKYQSYFMIGSIDFSQYPTKKGDSFLPTIYNLFNMSTNFVDGQLGLIIESNGVKRVIDAIDLSSCPTYSGYRTMNWSNYNSQLVFPSDVSDGEYSFYVASRAKHVDNDWSRALCLPYEKGIYKLIVKGDDISIEDYWGELEVAASLDVQHNLYSTYTGDFLLSFTNHDNMKPYIGKVAVGFYQDNILISSVGEKEIYLEPGELNAEIALSGKLTDVPAGDYIIYPIAKWGSEDRIIGKPTNVTVLSTIGLSDIRANSIDLIKNEFQADEEISILAQLAITSSGSSNVYDKAIDVVIFDSNSNEVGRYQQNVFLERGNAYDFNFSVNPSLPIGDYKLGLYKLSLMGSSLMLYQLPFKVIQGTGLEQNSNDHLMLVLDSSSRKLYIDSDAILNDASVYELSGATILYHNFSDGYVIDLSYVPDGIYLVSLRGEHELYTKKIVLKK